MRQRRNFTIWLEWLLIFILMAWHMVLLCFSFSQLQSVIVVGNKKYFLSCWGSSQWFSSVLIGNGRGLCLQCSWLSKSDILWLDLAELKVWEAAMNLQSKIYHGIVYFWFISQHNYIFIAVSCLLTSGLSAVTGLDTKVICFLSLQFRFAVCLLVPFISAVCLLC